MRKVSLLIGLCAIVAVGLNLSAQTARNKVEDLPAIMKDIQAGNTALMAASTAANAADAATQAGKLAGYFNEAATIFTKEKVDNAAKMAKEIATAADDIAKAAKTGKVADKAAVQASIGKCKDCHSLYRGGDAKTGYMLKK